MIAFVRVACVKPGKQGAAVVFAKEISAFLKGSYQIDVEVMRPVGGNPQRVAWTCRYPDLASMETITAKMLADPKYWELVNGASDNFIGGSTFDSFWQTV